MKLLTVSALVISVSASEDLAALQHHVSPVLAASNLLDSDDFFVCDSKVPGMNGHYVLQPSTVVQSDPDTPVFFREDSDEDGEQFTAVALAADTAATDFRLFRHNGFWMLADVEPWPPVTHFRCDPTKTQIIGMDVTDVCGLRQSTPPRIGYSPADPKLGDFSITLHRHGCQEPPQTEDQDAKSSRNNFSTRKEEL